MAVSNIRHNKAREAARAFLESVFTEAGTEISFSDLTARAIKAGVASSPSILNLCCVRMVEDGFLVREKKGVYKRQDPRGVPLAIPDPPEPAPAPGPADLAPAHMAALLSRISSLEATVASLDESVRRLLSTLS